jgi:membrane-bound lytic murein transglycosylase D
MEKPIPMNLFKLSCLLALVWLTGCASAPPVNSPSNPPSQAHSKAIASDTLTLHSTRELAAAPGTAQASFAKRAPMAVYDEYAPLADINAQPTTTRTVTSTVAPTDLWDRIRRGYGMPDLEHTLVHDREQWYTARPDYIFRMTERSKKYLFHIVEELELRNMPTELALLPFIESAFNPQAVSVAKAAGMWQFMPATGKYFDLKQNAFRDDRRDVLASTRAALDYLKKLHNMFGDWHLALAAYNWGEGSVGRAIAKNQRAGLPTGYLDLNMPMETRFYVPKLQAVKNIVAQPEVFNSRLPVIDNHPYFQSVTIRRDIDLVLAAKLAEVPLADFKALNPSINRPVIMAAGTPQILLPWDNAEVFQSNLEAYGGGRLASWTVWQAPTTMHPSEAARRVGMSESELRSVNAIPPKVVIRAGSSLLVPRNAHIATDVSEKMADNGQLFLGPEVVLKRSVVRAGKTDSVRSMARKYKVSPDQLAQWNKVPVSANFKRSQQVVLFLPYRVAKAKTPQPSKQLAANKKSVPAKGSKTKTVAVAAKSSKNAKNAKAQSTKVAKR